MALSAAALLKKLNLLECHRSHRSPWLQTPVWRRRTNQICYYWFSEIFHVLCPGFCCVFSVRIISVAEKDLHVVNSNFLSPSYSFLQCRVIRQHLTWSINSRQTVVVDISNIWSPFGFSTHLLTESIIVGTWALLMTQTSLLSIHLVTEMSSSGMKTI